MDGDTNASDDEDGGGTKYLAILVLIPLIAVIVIVIVIFVKRKNTGDSRNIIKASNMVAAPEEQVGETTPQAPIPAPTPHSPHHPGTDPSVTASMRTDDDPSTSFCATAESAALSCPDSVPYMEDTPRHTDEIVSTALGDIQKLPTATASSSPPAVATQGNVGYVIANKDQCRTVVGEEAMAMAVIVDAASSIASETNTRKRTPIDP